MNNYINPFLLIKEEFSEATTLKEKSLVVLFALWFGVLASTFAIGFGKVLFELITNPSQFSNVTWGIFDTLG